MILCNLPPAIANRDEDAFAPNSKIVSCILLVHTYVAVPTVARDTYCTFSVTTSVVDCMHAWHAWGGRKAKLPYVLTVREVTNLLTFVEGSRLCVSQRQRNTSIMEIIRGGSTGRLIVCTV
jgi:hypothetical protein